MKPNISTEWVNWSRALFCIPDTWRGSIEKLTQIRCAFSFKIVCRRTSIAPSAVCQCIREWSWTRQRGMNASTLRAVRLIIMIRSFDRKLFREQKTWKHDWRKNMRVNMTPHRWRSATLKRSVRLTSSSRKPLERKRKWKWHPQLETFPVLRTRIGDDLLPLLYTS